MKNKLKIGLAVALSVFTLVFLTMTLYRWTWDYTENGNYFDEETMTTYDNDSVLVFGTLTIIFFLPTLILLITICKAHARQKNLP